MVIEDLICDVELLWGCVDDDGIVYVCEVEGECVVG